MNRAVSYLLMMTQVACLITIVYASYLALGSKPVFAIVSASLILLASIYVESRLPQEGE